MATKPGGILELPALGCHRLAVLILYRPGNDARLASSRASIPAPEQVDTCRLPKPRSICLSQFSLAPGPTAAFGRTAARFALLATVAFDVLVSVWTLLAFPHIAQRWFSWPNIGYVAPVPILTALVAYLTWISIPSPPDWRPFLLALALFLLAYVGLGISLWPYAVPYAATLWEAASSPPTQAFVGVGTAVILPVVLGYFAFAHWVFRGKTATEAGYSH
jgi:cytochrome bd-type quinol oxidase subunit 2